MKKNVTKSNKSNLFSVVYVIIFIVFPVLLNAENKDNSGFAESAPTELNIVKIYSEEDNSENYTLSKFSEKDFQVKIANMLYSSPEAEVILKKINPNILPVFIIYKENLKFVSENYLETLVKTGVLIKKEEYYVIPPTLRAGIYYKREKIPNRLDVFVMSLCPFGNVAMETIIKAIKQKKAPENLKIYINYILSPSTYEKIEGQSQLKSMHGLAEVEEDIRQLVIEKYFPDKWRDYMLFRANNFQSTYWDDAAKDAGIDDVFVRKKAREEGESLLIKNGMIARDLGVNVSPTFIYENRLILDLDGLKKFTGIDLDVKSSCDEQ